MLEFMLAEVPLSMLLCLMGLWFQHFTMLTGTSITSLQGGYILTEVKFD